MKYQIGNDVWEVKEACVDNHNEEYMFNVFKNGECFSTACGYEFETESGACYAILNEYSTEG